MQPISAQPAPPKVHIIEPKQTGERRITVQKEVSNPYMMIAYHTPEAKNEDYYALNILSSILSNGKSSRLYASLVDNQQLATMVFTDYGDSFDPGLFNIYAVANTNITSELIENAI